MKKIEKIFFVGIKGVGMAPLSIIFKQAGFIVAGSDIKEEFITDNYLKKERLDIFEGFEEVDTKLFFDATVRDKCLVITTGAHKGFDNPQVVWAKKEGIQILTQGQALGELMAGKFISQDLKGVSIAGSHGKTTITALLATTLSSLGQDPSYTVGTGELFPLGSPGHLGKGSLLIAEADEYASEPVYDKVPKFLYQNPNYAIFNNIDFDHPDMFENIESVLNAFKKFALNIKSEGKLFVNGDDKYLKDLIVEKDIKIIRYGQNLNNDYIISKIVASGLSSKFIVSRGSHEIGIFELNIPGIVNAANALSVIAFLLETGFEYKDIRVALKVFKGSKRRCEILGNTDKGALIIDDYGHHPLEISTTLEVIRQAYPDKKLVVVFQPHTYSRTKSLLNEFANSFKNVHKLILLPIFKSQRDTERDNLSNEEYVGAHKALTDTIFMGKFDDVVEYIGQNYSSPDYIIVTMGAGDVYKIGYALWKN